MHHISKLMAISVIATSIFTGFSFSAPSLQAQQDRYNVSKHVLRLKNVMIRGLGGRCAEVKNASKKNFANIRLNKCHGKKHQRWNIFVSPSSKNITIKSALTNRCLTVNSRKFDDSKSYQNVMISDCSRTSTKQIWQLRGHQIYNLGKSCLEVKNAKNKNKVNIRTGRCNNLQHQKWRLAYTLKPRPHRKKNHIKSGLGACLQLDKTKGKNGVVFANKKCSRDAGQQWNYITDGTIRSVANGQCLQLSGDQNILANIVIRPCDGSPLGIWRVLDKQIAGYRSNCLRMKTRTTGPVYAIRCGKRNQLDSWTWQAVK